MGQWRTLDELVYYHMGPRRFAEEINRRIDEKYRAWPRDKITVYADPSSLYGDDKQDEDDLSWFDIVRRKTGLDFRAAPTNNLNPRLEAVRGPMTLMIDGRVPGYLLSPTCTRLWRAYASDYCYRRIKGPHERHREVPDKNEASHVADADQYAMLGGGEYGSVMERREASLDITKITEAIE